MKRIGCAFLGAIIGAVIGFLLVQYMAIEAPGDFIAAGSIAIIFGVAGWLFPKEE